MKKLLKTIVLLIVFSLSALNSFAQCPMCKASIESSQSNGSKSVGMGLNIGILMLLASVYVIIAIVAYFWYKNFKNNRFVEN